MEGDGKTMIGATGLVGSEGERGSSMLSTTGQATEVSPNVGDGRGQAAAG